jgi:hypothetical protein
LRVVACIDLLVDPFETMRVSEIMAQPAFHLPASMTITDAITFFTASDAPPPA